MSRVQVIEGKITANVRRKSRRNQLWFELAHARFELARVRVIESRLYRKYILRDLGLLFISAKQSIIGGEPREIPIPAMLCQRIPHSSPFAVLLLAQSKYCKIIVS